MLVELNAEVFTGYDQIVAVAFIQYGLSLSYIHVFYILQFHRRSFVFIQSQLFSSHSMTGFEQAFSILQFESYVEQEFAASLLAYIAHIQLHFGSLLWSHLDVFYTSATCWLTVLQYGPFHVVSRKIAEEVFIVYVDFTILQISWSDPNVLIDMAYFVHVRIRNTVRADQTVVAEVLVAAVVSIEVTTVCIDSLTVLACPAW